MPPRTSPLGEGDLTRHMAKSERARGPVRKEGRRESGQPPHRSEDRGKGVLRTPSSHLDWVARGPGKQSVTE